MLYRRRSMCEMLCVAAMSLGLSGNSVADATDPPGLEDLLEMRISSAARRMQSPAEAPSMVSVITASEIRRFGWRNLGEALASLRGLHTSYDRSYTYLGVRGFGRPGDFTSRVLLMIDGLPVNDGIYDQAPIGPEFPLDLSLVEQIEFVPGAGSVMYGGNAVLAVINVVTRSGAASGKQLELGLDEGAAGRVGVKAGWRDESGTDSLLAYSRDRSRGKDLYFESYQAAGANAWSRGLDHESNERLFAQVRRGGFAAALIMHDRVKGLPGGPYGIDLNSPGSRVRDRRSHANLSFEEHLSPVTVLRLAGYAMEVRYNGDWLYGGVSQPDGMETRGIGGEAILTNTAWNGHTVLAGLSHRRDARRRQFNAALDSNTPRTSTGMFIQDDVAISDSATFSAGLRQDGVKGNSDYRHLSPRLALILRPDANTVFKAVSGAAFRPPNAFETDYAFTGTNIANPALRSERSHTDELGLVRDFGPEAGVSASLHRTRIRDLISIERDPATNLQQHHNVGLVEARGLELEARARLGAVTVRGSVSWQRVRHHSGAEVANSPRQLANLLVDAPFGGGVHLGWESQYVGSRTTDSGVVSSTGERVGGHAVSHATLTGGLQRGIEWQIKLHNVFDRTYGNIVGTEYNANFPGVQQSPMSQMIQDRRNLSASLRWYF